MQEACAAGRFMNHVSHSTCECQVPMVNCMHECSLVPRLIKSLGTRLKCPGCAWVIPKSYSYITETVVVNNDKM